MRGPGGRPAEGWAPATRVTRMTPALRRYLAAVGRRLGPPRGRARSALAELRRRLEDSGAFDPPGVPPSAPALDPAAAAAQLAREFGLGAPPDPRRRRAALAGVAALAVVAAAGCAGWGPLVGRLPPGGRLLGRVAPGGARAGAAALLAAPLGPGRTDMLVGVHADGGRWYLVAWTVGPGGAAAVAGVLALPGTASAPTPVLAAGPLLPGGADAVAVGLGPSAAASGPPPSVPRLGAGSGTVLLVVWGRTGWAVAARAPVDGTPLALAVAPTAPGAGQDLYGLVARAGSAPALDRWAASDGGLALVQQAAAPPSLPPPAADGTAMQAGVAGGVEVLMVGSAAASPAAPCAPVRPVPEAAVVAAADLRPLWFGTWNGDGLSPVPGPASGPLFAEGYGPGGPAGRSPVVRWTGRGFTALGAVTCGVRLAGPAAPDGPGVLGAAFVGIDAYTILWTSAAGATMGEGAWPFSGDLSGYWAPRALVLAGPYLVRADPGTLDVAQWGHAAVRELWQGHDTTTVSPARVWPAGRPGAWGFSAASGEAYLPAGALWAPAGVRRAQPAQVWVRLDGHAFAARVAAPPSAGAPPLLELANARGRVSYRGAVAVAAGERIAQVVPLPLPGGRSALAAVVAPPPGAPGPERLAALALAPGGRLVPAGSAPLPRWPGGARAEVIPGAGRDEVVLEPAVAGVGAPHAPAAAAYFLWNGRGLRAAAAPAQGPPAWVAAAVAGGGRRAVAVGVVPVAGAGRLQVARLGRGGRWTVRTLPLPRPEAGSGTGGPVVLPLPDGSGRVLVGVGGSTLVYRVA